MASNLFNSYPVLAITITDKNGAQRRMHFSGAEIAIGRLDDNDLVLPKNNVSKRHARVLYSDGRCVVSDLQSTNGTYVNGRRINAPVAVNDGDKIYIGDYILSLSEVSEEQASTPPPLPDFSPPKDGQADEADDLRMDEREATVARPPVLDFRTTTTSSALPPPLPHPHQTGARTGVPMVPPRTGDNAGPTQLNATQASRPLRLPPTHAQGPSISVGLAQPEHTEVQRPRSSRPPAPPSSALAPAVRLQGALANLVERLTEQRKSAHPSELAGPASDYLDKLDTAMEELAQDGIIGPDLDRRFLREAAINELNGLGPLERLLRDSHTRRIVVDHPTRILVDQGKGLVSANAFFSSARAMNLVARRLLARGRVSFLPQNELHEATLPEGDHVLILSSPLVYPGPVIAIRCARREPVVPERLVHDGLVNADTLRVLRDAVQTRRNILVYGAAEIDLSFALSGLAGLAAAETRVLAIETDPGLSIAHPQVLTLTHHNADLAYGPLLQRAAHLACDHFILDDIKLPGAGAIMGWASHTHGILMGLHTNGQESGLEHLRTALLLAGHQDGEALHHLLARAIQLTVEVRKERDGQLRVTRVNELSPREQQMPEERPLFTLSNGLGNGRPSFLPE